MTTRPIKIDQKKLYLLAYVCGCLLTLLLSHNTRSEEISDTDQQIAPDLAAQAATNANAMEKPTVSDEYMRQKRLAEEINSLDAIWLTVSYDNSPNSIEVLGLEQASRLPNAQGAVLLLHDKFHHADWPGALRALRQALPDSGWHTLSISLPTDIKEEFPERELPTKTVEAIAVTPELKTALTNRIGESKPKPSNTGPKEETNTQVDTEPPEATESTTDENSETESTEANNQVDINLSENEDNTKELPYQERVLSHIEAGMNHLADSGYLNNILIAFGHSAQAALEYIQPKSGSIEAQGFALILVDPKLDKPFEADIGKALGKEFKAPVLDLVDGSNQENAKISKRRLTMAKVAQALTYQQVILPTINYGREHKTLLKRIDAWLKTYAPGMSARSVKNL